MKSPSKALSRSEIEAQSRREAREKKPTRQWTSLEATTIGMPVYQRLGFREIVRYRNYWPAGFLD
jgi:hypothetical protein